MPVPVAVAPVAVTLSVVAAGALLKIIRGKESKVEVSSPSISSVVYNAYFAKKIVENNGTTVRFERITSAILGKIVYLIVETINVRNQQLSVSIHSRDDVLGEDALSIMRFDSSMRNDGTHMPYVTDTEIVKRVGDFDDLETNNVNRRMDYTNLANAHADKIIIKLRLGPADRATFDRWTGIISDRIGNSLTTNLEIVVKRHSHFDMISDDEVRFLDGDGEDSFNIENKRFYEIYHGENNYNFLTVLNNQRAKIGSLINIRSNDVRYFYYDRHDNEHIVGRDRTIVSITSWMRQDNPGPQGVRSNEVAGFFHYYDNGGRIVSLSKEDTDSNGNPRIRYWVPYGTRRDAVVFEDVQGRALNYDYNNGIVVIILTLNTPRRHLDPTAYACLIGALAQCGFRDVTCNGFTCANGIGGPSVSHFNRVNGDFRYLRGDRSGERCLLSNPADNFDYDRQDVFNRALIDYGWVEMFTVKFTRPDRDMPDEAYRGVDPPLVRLGNGIGAGNGVYRLQRDARIVPNHDDHLHIDNLNVQNIHVSILGA